MMTDHLRQVVERLSQEPVSVQDRYAALIEEGLEQGGARTPQSQEPAPYPGYPLGVNPLEK